MLLILRQRVAAGLRWRLGDQPLEQFDVALRIQAVLALRALGLGQTVATLPGAQRVRLQTGFLYDGFEVIGRRIFKVRQDIFLNLVGCPT
jgi:hypothetical protein